MNAALGGLPRGLRRCSARSLAGPAAAAALLACGSTQLSSSSPSRRRRRAHAAPRGVLLAAAAARCEEPRTGGPPRFSFCARTDSYTPVFVATAAADMASVNVNGALLRGYARSVGNVGMKEDVYDRLYSAMLQEAQASPGRLRSALDAPKGAVAAMRDLGFVGSFARVPGSAARGVTGATFIDVYDPEHRPLCGRNVALIYVEGPNGNAGAGGWGLFGPERQVIGDRDEFLRAVEDTAANVMLAVREYNGLAEAGGAGSAPLPHVEALQFCLVSGGAYRHPGASKLDVAIAIVRGLISGCSGGPAGASRTPPAVQLAYDEDVFRKAVETVLGR
mmetsp:Transcript_9351/g.29747  ORF Transcript_9351/g.29747 Transcript_9351/m.29747 type:complete len:334 (-) Transcript_9351:58-1059(-)